MALTVQGSGSSATTTVTIPAHAVGDMIVIMARGTVVPTIPAAGGTVPTFSEIGTGGVNNSVGWRVARAIATATNHTSGTWANAAQMHVLVIRKSGSGAIGIGQAPAQVGANNTQTIVYPALNVTPGMADNLAVRCGARGVADTEVRTRGGFTASSTFRTEQPATTPTSAVFTKPITANEGSFSAATAGTNAAYRAVSFEVTEGQPRPATPTGAYGSVVHATTGLLHYWRLDEPSGVVAFDYKSTLDGAYVGSPALNQTGLIPAEPTGKCVSFDGVNDSVDIPDAASLDLTAAISVEFWVDATSFPADDTVIQKGGAWSFWSAGGVLRFEVDGVNSAEWAGAPTPTPGGKYHVVGTYDRTTVRLYANGVEMGTNPGTAAIIATANLLSVGRDTGGAPLFFAGKLSDLAIYNVALAPATVLAHYNAGQAGGPGIYNKSGGGTSLRHAGGGDKGVFSRQGGGGLNPGTAGGAKKVVVAKTGGAASTCSAGGPKAVGQGVTKTGGGVGARSSGGPKLVAYADTGGATSAQSAGGSDKGVFSRQGGGGLQPGTAGGAKKVVQVDTGGATSPLSAGGAKTVAQAIPKTGGAATPLSAGGPKVVQQGSSETGGASTALTTGGARKTAYADTGGAVSALSTGGAKKAVYSDTGGATTGLSTGGAKKLVSVRTGGGLTGRFAGAAKLLTKLATGGGQVPLTTGGAKKIAYADTGGATVPLSAGGPKSVTSGGVFDKTGGALTTLAAGGTKAVSQVFTKTGGGLSALLTGAGKVTALVKSVGSVSPLSGGAQKNVVVVKGGAGLPVSYEAEVLADSPRHYWRMGDLPPPLAPSAGTIELEVGASTAPDAVAGAIVAGDGAAQFDGSSDGLRAPNLDFTDVGVLTVELWLWWDGYANNDDLAMEFGTGSGQEGFFINPNSSLGGGGTPIAGAVFGVALHPGAVGGFFEVGFARPSAGAWHHLVAVIDKSLTPGASGDQNDSHAIKLYVDGARTQGWVMTNANKNGEEWGNFAPRTLYVMSRAGSSLIAAGRVDELALYPTLLDEARITAHYEAGLGGAAPTGGGVGATIPFGAGGEGTAAVGGIVTKTGGATTSLLAGGARLLTRLATGGGVSTRVAGATKVLTKLATGGGRTVLTTGGAKKVQYADTGGATATLRTGATKQLSSTKTGGGALVLVAGGSKSYDFGLFYSKTGGGVAALSGGATKLVASTRTGGGVLLMRSGGNQRPVKTQTGGARAGLSAGGTKTFSAIVAKTGGGIQALRAGGVQALDFGLFFSKTGGAIAGLVSGGAKKAVRLASGGGLVTFFSGATRRAESRETGGARLSLTTGGAKARATTHAGGSVLSVLAGGGKEFVQTLGKTGGGRAALSSGAARLVLSDRSGGASVPWRSGGTEASSIDLAGGGQLGLAGGASRQVLSVRTGGATYSYVAGSGTAFRGGAFVSFAAGASTTLAIVKSGGATLTLSAAGTRLLAPTAQGGWRLLTTGARHAVLTTSGRRSATLLNGSERGLIPTNGRRGAEVELSRRGAELT